ncbi:MAG TPA: RNA methyltransferase [Clostridiales bacterium]|nr:RNA methyltransferase [Clostridiales bacterium]
MNQKIDKQNNYKKYYESLNQIPNLNVEKLLNCYNDDKKNGVRFNLRKLDNLEINEENLENFLKKFNISCSLKQIDWCKTGFYFDKEIKLGKNLLHEMGAYYLQEPSAMAPVEFLNILPSDVVLDLCASPGGKTTQIAEKLNFDNGILISNEIVQQRAKTLVENVHRLGFGNVIVTNHSPKDLENKFKNFFDKILVDAPCSGEGMFRKNAEAITEWNENTPKLCMNRQKEIMESAYKMLKCGGTMVYSTCTFSIEENEMVVNYLLSNHSDLELISIDHKKFNFDNGIEISGISCLKNCARLYPYHIDGEGHFFAVIKKKKSDVNKNENMLLDCKNDKKISKKQQNLHKNKEKIEIFKQFEKKYLNFCFDNFVVFDDDIYANSTLDLNGLKVLSTGVYLGRCIKNIFTPSLHLSHFLKPEQCKRVFDITESDAKKYLEGYELITQIDDGWVLLTYGGISICFGKVSQKKIKNHYPKQLRKKI